MKQNYVTRSGSQDCRRRTQKFEWNIPRGERELSGVRISGIANYRSFVIVLLYRHLAIGARSTRKSEASTRTLGIRVRSIRRRVQLRVMRACIPKGCGRPHQGADPRNPRSEVTPGKTQNGLSKTASSERAGASNRVAHFGGAPCRII